MANVSIVIGNVNRSVPMAVPTSAEVIDSTGTSQKSTNSVPTADEVAYWIITAAADIWVKFGSNPTAVAGSDWLITSGQTREFKALSGQKAAVINA